MRISIDGLLQRIQGNNNEVSYPTARLVELGEHTSVFEVTNATEDYRVSKFGGERKQLEAFLDLVSAGDIVWDIGANVGLYAIFAARVGATVYAFEPDPEFADHLRRNVELNGQDISIHEFALADEEGTTTLYTDGTTGRSPSLSGSDEERGSATVDIRRGDALDLPEPDVLKVDVEGAEQAVLCGLGERLAAPRTLFIELHPDMLPAYDASVEEVRQILKDSGFETKWETQREEQIHSIYE